MRAILTAVKLAVLDWKHEARLSLCGVLALASIIVPLLILHGVHSGVISTLKDRLMSDPNILVIMPRGGSGAGFSEDFLEELSKDPEVQFAVGRTRDIATELQLSAGEERFLTVSIEPTGEKDPLLLRNHIPLPVGLTMKDDMPVGDIVFTEPAAKKLAVKTGDAVTARMSRRDSKGKLTQAAVTFTVTGILPTAAYGMDTAFLPLSVLNAVQDFRDSIDVPSLNIPGEHRPPEKRFYESFRLYASSLEAVEVLDSRFEARSIRVKTRAQEIAAIRKTDESLSRIVWVISLTAGIGFLAFMMSSGYAGVERKLKMLGLLRLLGLTRMSLLTYPLTQALQTGLCGILLAFGIYGAVAYCIDFLFAEAAEGTAICVIPPYDFLFVFLMTELLAAIASLGAAVKASSVEPSGVIRSV